jgi:hypothetical protein
MTKRIALLVISYFMLTANLFAPDSAPPKDKCEQDQLLWLIQIANEKYIDSLRYQEVRTRVSEMLNCANAYGKNEPLYCSTAFTYEQEIERRFVTFMFKRHPDIGRKFTTEDAGGLR